MSAAVTTADRRSSPMFPYEYAIVNMILLLVALGAVLDDKDTELRYRFLTAGALVLIGAILARKTWRSGHVPTRETSPRLRPDQRNVAGWTAVCLIVADVAMVPALFLT